MVGPKAEARLGPSAVWMEWAGVVRSEWLESKVWDEEIGSQPGRCDLTVRTPDGKGRDKGRAHDSLANQQAQDAGAAAS